MIGTIVVGPILTGVLVVGALAYTAHHDKMRKRQEESWAAAERTVSEQESGQLTPSASAAAIAEGGSSGGGENTRERQITDTFTRAADGFCTGVAALDERVGVSRATLTAITKAQVQYAFYLRRVYIIHFAMKRVFALILLSLARAAILRTIPNRKFTQ